MPIEPSEVATTADARSIVEETLRAYPADFLMHTDETSAGSLVLDEHSGS